MTLETNIIGARMAVVRFHAEKELGPRYFLKVRKNPQAILEALPFGRSRVEVERRELLRGVPGTAAAGEHLCIRTKARL